MYVFNQIKKYKKIKCVFFSRRNGFSNGIYKSLNCGIGSKDKKKNVVKNRNLALKKIGLQRKKLIIPNQTHSNRVVFVNEKTTNNKIYADALITDSNKIVIGILTADCAPVCFFDYKKNIVSIVHVGWKGAKNNIIKNTIKLMLECGSKTNNIISCIGPCIGKYSYEVKDDFFKKFIAENKQNKKFFLKKSNKMFFDLKSYIIKKINILGIKKVFLKKFDTFKDEKNFFSYRRSVEMKQKDYGRCLSVISLN